MFHVVLPFSQIAVAIDRIYLAPRSVLLGLLFPFLPQGLGLFQALGDRHVCCFCWARGCWQRVGDIRGSVCPTLCQGSGASQGATYLSSSGVSHVCSESLGQVTCPWKGSFCAGLTLSSPLACFSREPLGVGSDGTIAWEPRETSRAFGFVMASGRICPRAAGDSHTFNN